MGAFWRSRPLRPLGITRGAGSAAEWLWYTAATVFAYQLDGVPAVGLIAVSSVLPAALLSPPLGYLVDRYPRHRVLTGANVVRVLAVGLAALTFYAGFDSVALLALFTALEGAATLLVRPAATALLPFLTHRPAELVQAQAALGALENGGLLVGSISGGLLLAAAGPGVAFTVAAGLAAVAVLASLRIRHEVTEQPGLAPGGLGAVARQSLAGVPALFRDGAWAVTTVTLTTLLVAGAAEVLTVAIALDLLDLGEAWPGALTACVGLGGLIGAAVMSGIRGRRLGGVLVAASVLVGAPLAAVAGLQVTAAVVLLLVVFGAGLAVAAAASQAQLQRVVDDAELGRALGVAEAIGYLAMAAGAAVTPRLVDAAGLAPSLVVVGAVAPAGAVLLARALRRVDDGVAVDLAQLEALDGIAFLDPLPNVVRARIAGRVTSAQYEPGQVVTYQGERGDAFFVVDHGAAEVLVDGRPVASLGEGAFFGELALLTDRPRTATVRATEPLSVRVLHRQDFLTIVTGHAGLGSVVAATADERSQLLPARRGHGGLETVPLLCYLPPVAVDALSDAATSRAVAEGEVVYRAGDPADEVYVVVTGRVREDPDGDAERLLGPGTTFGEAEALRARPRPTAAVAAADCQLLCLPGPLVRATIHAI